MLAAAEQLAMDYRWGDCSDDVRPADVSAKIDVDGVGRLAYWTPVERFQGVGVVLGEAPTESSVREAVQALRADIDAQEKARCDLLELLHDLVDPDYDCEFDLAPDSIGVRIRRSGGLPGSNRIRPSG